MKILGIDPGYAILGYGVIEKQGNRIRSLDHGAITTEAGTPMPERLKSLYTGLMEVIARNDPDEAAIEELFFNTNAKTVIDVGQARGVCVLACVNSGIPIAEYTPLQVKQALTGYGRADKGQVQAMVKMMLNFKEVPKPDDTADALAIAICHGNSAGGNERLKKAIEKAEKEDMLSGKKSELRRGRR